MNAPRATTPEYLSQDSRGIFLVRGRLGWGLGRIGRDGKVRKVFGGFGWMARRCGVEWAERRMIQMMRRMALEDGGEDVRVSFFGGRWGEDTARCAATVDRLTGDDGRETWRAEICTSSASRRTRRAARWSFDA